MNARLQPTLFAGTATLVFDEAVDLTIQSLRAYGPSHRHWGVAWSGGKDSSALLTLVCHLIDAGRIEAPETLTVFYADTRQELPPLQAAAFAIMDQLRARGIAIEVVTAPMDKRFLVYMLGRGVPPPNNNTLRWCTRQIKVDPMATAIEARLDALERNDIGRFTIWNKFAFQTKDVRELRTAADPVGPDNDLWIEKAIRENDIAIVAWGPLAKLPRPLRGRWREVVAIAERCGKPLLCFGTAGDGQPLHPCMLGYENALRPWSPPA